jgi:hypothetical protein
VSRFDGAFESTYRLKFFLSNPVSLNLRRLILPFAHLIVAMPRHRPAACFFSSHASARIESPNSDGLDVLDWSGELKPHP